MILLSRHRRFNPFFLPETAEPTAAMTQSERESLFTLRWHLRERWGTEDTREKAMEILGALLDPKAQPQERPSVSAPDQHLLWCPFALTDFPRSRTRGSYRKGYPEGAVVHFTAGRNRPLADEVRYQVESGYTYFVIDPDGNLAQNFPLDSWGHHAGESCWPGLGDSVSSKLVGIEIQNAGLLQKSGNEWKSWFGVTIPAAQRRTIATNTAKQQMAGTYHRYTQAQENTLIRLLTWLKTNHPSVFSYDLVLGHDEVSGQKGLGRWRKNDPGGALSMKMDDLRAKLKNA